MTHIGIFYMGRRTHFEQENEWVFHSCDTPERIITPFFEPLMTTTYTKKGLSVFYEEAPFPQLDMLICRTAAFEEPSLHSVTLDFFKQIGCPMINAYPTVSLSRNKLAQQQILSEAGVPVPDWAVVRHPSQMAIAVNHLGFPMMAKVAIGGRGKGVFYIENEKTLQPILDYLNIRDRNPVILQKCITESAGKDIRVFVIGNQAVAAMERISQTKDVRANVAVGGRGTSFDVTPDIEHIALEAAKAMQLEIAGVDILLSTSGPVVIEVNACPVFSELQEVTGINIAEKIIEYAESKISHKK